MRSAVGLAGGLVALFATSRACADEAACERARVIVEGHPADRWSLPIARACDALVAQSGRDASAAVRIVPSGGDVLVEVLLEDGRSTIRRVTSPPALADTLEALIALPVTPVARPAEPPTPGEIPPPSEPAARAGPAPPRPLAVEIGVSVAGRIASARYTSIAPTAEANLVAGHWLFGLWARWDVASWQSIANPAGFEMDTLAAGLGVARRLGFSVLDLDVGVSPRLVAETQTYESGNAEHSLAAFDVRLASFVRASFGHSALRFLTSLDGEISPLRLRRSIYLERDLPALPAWGIGLAAGLSWSPP